MSGVISLNISATNIGVGRTKQLVITNTATTFSLVILFPNDWNTLSGVFNIPANRKAILKIYCSSDTDAGVVATWELLQ